MPMPPRWKKTKIPPHSFTRAGNDRSPGCGWGLPLPIDRENFRLELTDVSRSGWAGTVALTSDTRTNASTATAVWVTCVANATCPKAPAKVALHPPGEYGTPFLIIHA